MLTLMFPGQGSQKKGMGAEIFDKYKDLVKICDNVLDYSIVELCLEDPNNVLGQTKYTQVALYVVSSLMYLEYIENNEKPSYVAGHSLGEYVALFASGAFDFETGLRLVKKRGELMSKADGGVMAAVIGASENRVKKILEENNFDGIDVANFNSQKQIVISGLREDIFKAEDAFLDDSEVKTFIPLNVSGAFHSRYMKELADEFKEYINQFEFNEFQIPVISNYTARIYSKAEVKENLYRQMFNSVRWDETVRYLMGKGVTEFKEIGPGNVLTNLVNRIIKEEEPLIIEENTPIDSNNKENNNIGNILGDNLFKSEYNVDFSYYAGGMYKGIASIDMIVKLAKSRILSFYGTGGVSLDEVNNAINTIKSRLNGETFGVNVLYNPNNLEYDMKLINMIMDNNINCIEAAAYFNLTPALVFYRAKGLYRDSQLNVMSKNKIIAKISRPEVLNLFLNPAPEKIVNSLLDKGLIDQNQASMLKEIPMADDICVEADSGGHTDAGNPYSLIPTMIKIRDEFEKNNKNLKHVRVGAGGGIGTPESACAAFMMGAEFITTGSINQCTVEANISDIVKDMLQNMSVNDTQYAPSGDMFEFGSKVQVLKKGVFFPTRANKLYELYRQYNSLDEIDMKTKDQLEKKYFKKTFEEVYDECKEYYSNDEIEKAESSPKIKMAMIFKWYLGRGTKLALMGDENNKVDFQILTGPSLGAFNEWVKGSNLESWHNRHVDEIAIKLMNETATYIINKCNSLYEKIK